jgi:hypothetical protein
LKVAKTQLLTLRISVFKIEKLVNLRININVQKQHPLKRKTEKEGIMREKSPV